MTNRENALAILHYENYQRMPIVAFGFWAETVHKWADEGYITREEADHYCTHGDNGVTAALWTGWALTLTGTPVLAAMCCWILALKR